MPLDLTALRKAVDAYQSIADALPNGLPDRSFSLPIQNAIKSGVVQHFEFTYELSWKMMKRWLDSNLGSVYIDGVTRKELFRIAAEHQLIDDTEIWFGFHNARNRTLHLYNAALSDEVYRIALSFLPVAARLLKTLEAKND